MKAYYFPIFVLMLLIAIVFFGASYRDKLREEIAVEKERVITLEKDAVAKDLQIINLESEKEALKKEIGSLNNKLAIIQQNRKTIKNKRDEDINTIGNYNTIQLDKFFSENYPE